MSTHAAEIEALDPSGENGLHFHGRYRLIGPAALIDQRSRRGFGISVQVKSASQGGLGTPAVVNTHCATQSTRNISKGGRLHGSR